MQISGFIAVFAGLILSRILSERGFRLLSDEQKLRLMDSFSKTRAFAMIPFAVLIGVFLYLKTQTAISTLHLATGYFITLLVYFVLRFIVTRMKLKKLDLPAAYLRLTLMAQGAFFVGCAWFFYTIYFQMTH